MDITKYKSVAIDVKTYEKLFKLTSILTPGLRLSRSQVVKSLINEKSEKYLDSNTNDSNLNIKKKNLNNDYEMLFRANDYKLY